MKSGLMIFVIVAASAMVATKEGLTHHSFPYVLTANGEETLATFAGTIREVKLFNPHAGLIVSVEKSNTEVEEWLVEVSSRRTLVNRGWTDETIKPGDKVTMTVSIGRVERRARLRAMLVHGATSESESRLFVEYSAARSPLIMARLRERLRACESITEQCFRIDAQTLRTLQEEFPGQMGYVL